MICDEKTEARDLDICRGCLSLDRKLSFMATGDWYFSLLTAKQNVQSGHLAYIALCWECTALLRRTRRFQAQVQRAHEVLQDSLPLLPAKKTLSLLSISKHLKFDATFEETEYELPIINEINSSTIKDEKVIVPTKYKSEVSKSIEEYEKTNQIDQNDDFKNEISDICVKFEPTSDDGENSEDDNVVGNNFSSSEEITDFEDDDSEKYNKNSPHIVKQPLKNNETINNKLTMPLNVKKKADRKTTNDMPIIKTPAVLNVELELQKLIKIKKIAPKRKRKLKQGDDPDYKLQNDKKFKEINADNEGKQNEGWTQTRKFRSITTKYEHIADVLLYFQEIEMSEKDIKIALEKDDAVVDKKAPEKCNVCGRQFRRLEILKNHGKMFHKKTHPDLIQNGNFCNPPPVLPQKSVWRCMVCNRVMRREHMLAHMNRYHRQKFACIGDGCEWRPETFWERADRNRHWREIHKQYICGYCNKCTSRTAVLEKHMKVRHPSEVCPATLQCQLCSRMLSSRESLRNHMQNVHNSLQEPKELRYCVECDVTFKRIISFQTHFRKKHSGQPKQKWPCPQCGKVMASKKLLRMHVAIIHTRKTKYHCHICGKYLSKPYALRRHLDYIHNKILRSKEKNEQCTICGRRFSSKFNLQYHTYTHTGERPYKCPHCETAFTRPYCLRTHLAKQHQVVVSIRIDGTILPATTTNTAAGH